MTFDFFNVPRIVFSAGVVQRLSELLSSLGQRPMLIHNAPVPESVARSLPGGTPVHAQAGEPSVAYVDLATELARKSNCDCVIGFGGGSAVDTAKAVAALLANGGSALDYLEVVGGGQKVTRPAVPWIAIPTTAGTGAEATRNAVIAVPEKQFKASLRSELIMARVALIDPELQFDCPAPVTAASGMDALCQCIEAYTSANANAMTDPLALQGVTLAGRSLRTAFAEPRNVAARSEMALAALLSGITLTNAGLGAVHGFAAPLGANFPVPHGVVCAALLPHVIRANILIAQQDPAKAHVLVRYATIGRALSAYPLPSDSAAIEFAGRFTAYLLNDLQIPGLSRFGLSAEKVPEMVQLAKRASSMKYNPVTLPDGLLADALTMAI
jgi:alcohol dehydrogenase class IV